MAKDFIPVNELLKRTTLGQFIDHYNFDTEVRRKGNEERMRNPFACDKCRGNNQAVSVNWQAAVFTSHCYHCSVRGRVTTLLFGMKYGHQPSGGKLKGNEFKDIAADIAQVAGHRGNNRVEQVDFLSRDDKYQRDAIRIQPIYLIKDEYLPKEESPFDEPRNEAEEEAEDFEGDSIGQQFLEF